MISSKPATTIGEVSRVLQGLREDVEISPVHIEFDWEGDVAELRLVAPDPVPYSGGQGDSVRHLHLELPAGLHERLKERAAKEGRSVSEETRRAVRVRLGEPEEGTVDGVGA